MIARCRRAPLLTPRVFLPKQNVTRSIPAAVAVMWIMPWVAWGQNPLVTISGGSDPSAHNYAWTVTNRHTSPIVHVEFPHYHADTFFAPEGWSKQSTFLLGVGVADKPGLCTATAKSPSDGIAPGRSAEFGMRIGGEGAPRGSGTVQIRFADGSDTTVNNVELPERATAGTRYMPLIGLAAIFAIWIAIKARRSRRAAPAESGDSEFPSDDGGMPG